MKIVAIDPGTFESAYVVLDVKTNAIVDRGQESNKQVLKWLAAQTCFGRERLVIEMIKSYGMAVGDETFTTCVWIGRFMQVWNQDKTVDLLPRKTIVTTVCNSPRANDANVRRAMLDRYGKSATLGFSKDMWSALAVASAWSDIEAEKKMAAERDAAVQNDEFLT